MRLKFPQRSPPPTPCRHVQRLEERLIIQGVLAPPPLLDSPSPFLIDCGQEVSAIKCSVSCWRVSVVFLDLISPPPTHI